MTRVAMLSVHTCPLAALGGKETGGMNVYVRELSRALGRMGVAVDVFTRSQNPEIARVVELGPAARVIHLASGPEAPLPRECVRAHLDEFLDGVEAWRITRGLDYDVIHAHYWLSGAVALDLRRRWSVPVVQMFHTLGRLKNGVVRSAGDLEPAVRLEEEARLVAEADRIVASTEVERAALVREWKAAPVRVAVIPCGVDTDLFRPGSPAEARHALGLDDRPLVLYVGRIAPIKGLDTLLEAVRRLRDRGRRLRLLVVGGEADEPPAGHEAELRRRVHRLGLDDTVSFVGAQAQPTLRTYYVAADVTVLPSYYESFGMVALEAMACGSPVVASRVGGLATTVRDGVTGFLVPDGDAVALGEQLDVTLADPALRGRLGREGVRWAMQHRWPRVADAMRQEYDRLLPRPARASTPSAAAAELVVSRSATAAPGRFRALGVWGPCRGPHITSPTGA